MPPLPVWFTGRDAVTRFLARRAFAEPGDMVLVPTAANGQPAVAEYRRAPTGSCGPIRYMSWRMAEKGSPH